MAEFERYVTKLPAECYLVKTFRYAFTQTTGRNTVITRINTMKPLSLLLLSIITFSPAMVFAVSGGTVEAMQMPAWYERDGETHALKPGTRLYSGDVIRTGRNSRALLRMSEGSLIKLGADAWINFTTLNPPAKKEGAFAALLRVSRGAFRFTTTELGKSRKRNVDVKIGTVTIGIRGTDIWGRSRLNEDLFALLEGKVTVQRDGEAEFIMQDKLSYILAAKDQPTSAVAPIDPDELGVWAEETETQQGQGILTSDGEWAVNMISLQNNNAADKLQQLLNAAGYAAELQEVSIDGNIWLRLRIKGFDSRDDADSFASTINSQYGIQRPWIVNF